MKICVFQLTIMFLFRGVQTLMSEESEKNIFLQNLCFILNFASFKTFKTWKALNFQIMFKIHPSHEHPSSSNLLVNNLNKKIKAPRRSNSIKFTVFLASLFTSTRSTCLAFVYFRWLLCLFMIQFRFTNVDDLKIDT